MPEPVGYVGLTLESTCNDALGKVDHLIDLAANCGEDFGPLIRAYAEISAFRRTLIAKETQRVHYHGSRVNR